MVHLLTAGVRTHAEMTVLSRFPVSRLFQKRVRCFSETAVAALLMNLFVNFTQDVMFNGALMLSKIS